MRDRVRERCRESFMFRFFQPSSIDPQWVGPAPQKDRPDSLKQAALFSLYAPFVMLLVGAIAGTAFPFSAHLYVWLAVTITALVVFAAGLLLGVVGLVGGIKQRWTEVCVYASWGCLFSGTFLIFRIAYLFAN
jgi:hypothetical protein